MGRRGSKPRPAPSPAPCATQTWRRCWRSPSPRGPSPLRRSDLAAAAAQTRPSDRDARQCGVPRPRCEAERAALSRRTPPLRPCGASRRHGRPEHRKGRPRRQRPALAAICGPAHRPPWGTATEQRTGPNVGDEYGQSTHRHGCWGGRRREWRLSVGSQREHASLGASSRPSGGPSAFLRAATSPDARRAASARRPRGRGHTAPRHTAESSPEESEPAPHTRGGGRYRAAWALLRAPSHDTRAIGSRGSGTATRLCCCALGSTGLLAPGGAAVGTCVPWHVTETGARRGRLSCRLQRAPPRISTFAGRPPWPGGADC